MPRPLRQIDQIALLAPDPDDALNRKETDPMVHDPLSGTALEKRLHELATLTDVAGEMTRLNPFAFAQTGG